MRIKFGIIKHYLVRILVTFVVSLALKVLSSVVIKPRLLCEKIAACRVAHLRILVKSNKSGGESAVLGRAKVIKPYTFHEQVRSHQYD